MTASGATSLALLTLLALTARAEEIILSDTGHRARVGFSAEGGSSVGHGGIALHAELRLGFQLSREFSIFGVAGGGLGLASAFGGQLDLGWVVEVILGDHFYLGAGLLGSYGQSTLMDSSPPFGSLTDATAGFRPTFDFRMGFSTGASRPPFFSRGGFSVGVHALLMLHPDMIRSSTLPGTFRTTSTRAPAEFVFTPMLSLGFDFR